jgi:endonuclease/exonuclease/phosphatase family metal-dependent hydrolase
MRGTQKLAVIAFLLALPALAQAADRGQTRNSRPIRVMTQNLYVGADIFRVFQAQTPEEVPFVVAGIWQTIEDTNFPERAARIAAEIDHERPDVVGLQEVAWLTRLSPGDPPQVDEIEFLAILVDALQDRGLDYVVAGVVMGSDTELPIVTPTGLGLVRYIDRDAVLVRSTVEVSEVTAGNYLAMLEVPIGDPPVAVAQFKRGYVTMKLRFARRWFRLANTHLEIEGSGLDPMIPFIQAAQAQELIGLLAGETLPVIVTGDLNSSPLDLPAPPLVPPYWQLVGAGYADVWESKPGAMDPGYSCCQAEDLLNPLPMLTQRIDFIFVRNDLGSPGATLLGPVRVEAVGDEPADLTPSGLWPSDHAGVAAQIHVPLPNGHGHAVPGGGAR